MRFKFVLCLFISFIFGCCSMFLILHRSEEYSFNDYQNSSSIVEGYIRTYQDDLLNQKSLTTEEESLYIDFKEDSFFMKAGDTFDYYGSVIETNGEIDSINAIRYDLQPGLYVVAYTVRNGNNLEIKREYDKLLVVR